MTELVLRDIGELPRDPEARQAFVTLQVRKLSDATGCPEAIEQAYALGYRAAEEHERWRNVQRFIARHSFDDVDPDIAEEADRASNPGDPQA